MKALYFFEKSETDYPLRGVISQVSPTYGSFQHSSHDVSEVDIHTPLAGRDTMLDFPDGVGVSLASESSLELTKTVQ